MAILAYSAFARYFRVLSLKTAIFAADRIAEERPAIST